MGSITEEVVIEDVEKNGVKPNTYAAKKTVAQGMMDIALLTANANQLRYVLKFSKESSTYIFAVALIIISLTLQIIVGGLLIFKGRYNLKGTEKLEHANRINNYVVAGVFLITIVNVLIGAFSLEPPQNLDLLKTRLDNITEADDASI